MSRLPVIRIPAKLLEQHQMNIGDIITIERDQNGLRILRPGRSAELQQFVVAAEENQ